MCWANLFAVVTPIFMRFNEGTVSILESFRLGGPKLRGLLALGAAVLQPQALGGPHACVPII